MHRDQVGLIQVYTGNGKGKTTAALGLALRAAGNQMSTYIGQFLKGFPYGELAGAPSLAPLIVIEQFGLNEWGHADGPNSPQRTAAHSGLEKARQALVSGSYDLVILDEINIALAFGLLETKEVLALIDARPPQVELVLTGRHAPQAILDRADLITEMIEVRHPYQKGIQARKGIEF